MRFSLVVPLRDLDAPPEISPRTERSTRDFLKLLKNGKQLGVKHLEYAYQEGEGGIADALKLAEDFADGDKVVVILGDNIIEKNIKRAVADFFTQPTGAKILLKEVDDPQRFGVPKIENGKITQIIEKPKDPPTNFAVIGIYMYDNDVFSIAKTLKPSARGELEITDVNNEYLRRGDLTHATIDGWWTDAGTFESLLRANASSPPAHSYKVDVGSSSGGVFIRSLQSRQPVGVGRK